MSLQRALAPSPVERSGRQHGELAGIAQLTENLIAFPSSLLFGSFVIGLCSFGQPQSVSSAGLAGEPAAAPARDKPFFRAIGVGRAGRCWGM